MTNQAPFNVPKSLVNVAKLREEALDKTFTPDNRMVTLRERIVIAILIGRELGHRHQLMDAVREDIQTWEIPKFTALLCWLAPYSIVSSHPNAVIRVARYLLGHTREEEEASIDWSAVRSQYPQL